MAVNEKIAQAYAVLVREGRRSIDDIKPKEMKARVLEILSVEE